MSLQRLLRLLPIGLVVLVALNMAMMVVQDGQSRATFDQVRSAQVQRDLLAKTLGGTVRALWELVQLTSPTLASTV